MDSPKSSQVSQTLACSTRGDKLFVINWGDFFCFSFRSDDLFFLNQTALSLGRQGVVHRSLHE